MAEWFRSWHGAPTDPKWLVIGRKANVAPGVVSAIFWALCDYASQEEDRGSIDGFDIETYSAFSGFDEEMVARVIGALADKGLIEAGHLSAWERRQPKREDDSTARVRASRERQRVTAAEQHDEAPGNDMKRTVTQGNSRTEQSREDIPPLPPQAAATDAAQEEEREIAPATPRSAPARRLDPFFDGMVAALELDPQRMTASERGRVNAALKQIRDVGGRPEEIPRAIAAFRELYPNADCTPTAVAGHWSRLLSGNGKRRGRTADEIYGRLV